MATRSMRHMLGLKDRNMKRTMVIALLMLTAVILVTWMFIPFVSG
jgi:hypothetical protein